MRFSEMCYWNSNTYGKVFKVTDKTVLISVDRLIPTFSIPTLIYLGLEKMGKIKPRELFRIPLHSRVN